MNHTASADCDTVHTGARNTFDRAVATPTDSGVFACPEFDGYGQGGADRETARMALSMFLTPFPPNDRRKSDGGFQTHRGAKTMPTGTPTTTPIAASTGNTPKRDVQSRTSPTTSLTDTMRAMLIDGALCKARKHLNDGSMSLSLGQTLVASRHLKQACSKATTGGRA